jgi:Sec-independent protein secretion pathway component TatC
VILVTCAILLPTVDPVSLALEVVPLLLLFELSIVFAAILERRWRSASAPLPELARRTAMCARQ